MSGFKFGGIIFKEIQITFPVSKNSIDGKRFHIVCLVLRGL